MNIKSFSNTKILISSFFLMNWKYTQTSMAQTSLRPWKFVLRHENFEPERVNHSARSGGKWG